MLLRLESPFHDLDPSSAELRRQVQSSRVPVDAYRRDDAVFLHFDLPGVDPSSVDLTLDQNTLTVSAERNWPSLEGDEMIITERPQGGLRRQFILGESLDTERIVARCDQGVLTIVIPVAAQSQPRKVPVSRTEPEVVSPESVAQEQPKRGILHRHQSERAEDTER